MHCSGSTSNSHTVSGLAAMSTSRSTERFSVPRSTPPPLFLLRLALERRESFVPEPLEEPLQLGEHLGACAVQAPCAFASLAHKPGLLEHREVLRHGGTRHVEVRRNLAGRELAIANQGQDLAPTG